MGRVRMSYGGWSLSGIEGVIFDKDGTLIDVHPYWGRVVERRVGAIIERYGLPPVFRAPLSEAMGLDTETNRLLRDGPVGIAPRETVIAAALRRLKSVNIVASASEIEQIFAAEHAAFGEEMLDYCALLPGVSETVAALRNAGIPLALVTADDGENARRLLRHLGLENDFDTVLGRDSTPGPKTTGRAARKAAEQMGIPTQNIAAIGDAPPDAIMARNAGLKGAVLTASGQSDLETLRAESPYTVPILTALDIKEEAL